MLWKTSRIPAGSWGRRSSEEIGAMISGGRTWGRSRTELQQGVISKAGGQARLREWMRSSLEGRGQSLKNGVIET